MALQANLQRKEGSRHFEPHEFNPYAQRRQRPQAQIGDLISAFTQKPKTRKPAR